jgi:hypothetical protein
LISDPLLRGNVIGERFEDSAIGDETLSGATVLDTP